MKAYTPTPYHASIFLRLALAGLLRYKFGMKHVHPEHEKKALVVRLRRIRGQVEAIERMVTEDTDCPEVLNQVISARGALKSFGEEIIHAHLHECIEHARNPAESERRLRSFLTVLERYVR